MTWAARETARTRVGVTPAHPDALARSPSMRRPPRPADAAADAPAVAGTDDLMPSL